MSPRRSSKEDLEAAGFNVDRALEIAGYAKGASLLPEGGESERSEVLIHCPCRSHEDANPSASLNTESGQWYCFPCGEGGDLYALVAAALGLDTRRDFIRVLEYIQEHIGGGRHEPVVRRRKANGNQRPTSGPRPFPGHFRGGLKCVAKYLYQSTQGTRLQKWRLVDPKTGAKTFRWIHERPGDGWFTTRGGMTPRPFIPGEWSSSPGWTFWTEGEKDAQTLQEMGLAAFHLEDGFKGEELSQWLCSVAQRGELVILEDSDEAGRKKAQKKALDALQAGISVRVVRFPMLPEKGDVTDFFEMKGRGAGADFRRLVEQANTYRPAPAITLTEAVEALSCTPRQWLRNDGISRSQALLMSCLSWVQGQGYTEARQKEWKGILSPDNEDGWMAWEADQILGPVVRYAESSTWHKQGRRGVIEGGHGSENEPALAWNEGVQQMEGNKQDLLTELRIRHEIWEEIDELDQQLTAEQDKDRNKKLKDAEKRLFQEAGLSPKGPTWLWKYTAGAGKTHIALEVIREVITIGGRVLFLSHNHTLAEETRQRAEGLGIDPIMIRGRTRPGVCPVEEKTGLMSKLQQAGIPSRGLCEHHNPVTDEVQLCDFRKAGKCPYWEAMDEALKQEPGLVIATHDYSRIPTALLKEHWDLVVIDEDLRGCHKGHKISRDELLNPMIWREDVDERPDEKELEEIWAWMEGGCPVDQANGRGWDRAFFEQLKGSLTKLGEDHGNHPLIRPNIIRRQQDLQGLYQWIEAGVPQEDESRATSKTVERARVLFETLSIELKHGREIQAVHPVKDKAKKENGEEVHETKIHIERVSRPQFGKEVPTLVLDATANERAAQEVYGKDLKVLRVQLQRDVKVTQLTNSTFSRSYLGLSGGNMEKALRECRGLIKATQPDCVITYKEVLDHLGNELKKAGIKYAHFGALVGLNEMEECRRLLIIGRHEPPVWAVENAGRASNSQSPSPLHLTGEMSRSIRWYCMKDGSKNGVLVRVHEDPIIQAWLESVRESEQEQAIDRLRTVRPGQGGKEIIIACNVPIPGLEINELTTKDELLRTRGVDQRLGRVFDELGIIPLAWNGDHLSKIAPREFETSKSAEHAIRRTAEMGRTEGEDLYPPLSYNLFIESGGYKLDASLRSRISPIQKASHYRGEIALVEYRAGNARRWAPAMIQMDKAGDDLEDFLRTALEEAGIVELMAFRVTCRLVPSDVLMDAEETSTTDGEEGRGEGAGADDLEGSVYYFPPPALPSKSESVTNIFRPARETPPGRKGLCVQKAGYSWDHSPRRSDVLLVAGGDWNGSIC